MEVTETLLPGVGIRYEFFLDSGAHTGVVLHRDGRAVVLLYEPDDPDICNEVMTLSPTEAETLADLLGGPRFAERFADLTREVPGLVSLGLPVLAGSRYAGGTLGDTKARTRTGASIVAIVRGKEVVTSPVPSEPLHPGDVLVVIGSDAALDAVRNLLAETAV
jgi:TrkA domain protein